MDWDNDGDSDETDGIISGLLFGWNSWIVILTILAIILLVYWIPWSSL